MPELPRPTLRLLLLILVLAVLGAAAGLAFGPRPIPLGEPSGDPDLVRDAGPILQDSGNDGIVSVVRIRDGRASWAGFGDVTAESRFEIGSLTKSFNGLLLADAVARGEVGLDDRLDAHLTDLAGTDAGAATLRELAQHTSGLPGNGSMDMLQVIAEDLAGASYTAYEVATPANLLADARRAHPTGRGLWAYSNLGASLLGHALAAAAGAPDWGTLVTERVFEPLGMADTRVARAGSPDAGLLPAHNPNGRPMGPQTSDGYAPAGIGVTSSAADLSRYAAALLAGTAPGMHALDPTFPITSGQLASQQMGLAWVVSGDDGEVVWHNGMTGGMASLLAIDRSRGTGAIVLTDRARDVTGPGLALLADGADTGLPAIPRIDADTVGWVVVGGVWVALFVWASLRGRSRVRIAGQGLGAAGALLVWGIAQPWDWSPPWTFGLAVGLVLGALVAAGRRWSGLGWLPERGRPWAVLAGALGVGWFAAMVALAAWVLGLAVGQT